MRPVQFTYSHSSVLRRLSEARGKSVSSEAYSEIWRSILDNGLSLYALAIEVRKSPCADSARSSIAGSDWDCFQGVADAATTFSMQEIVGFNDDHSADLRLLRTLDLTPTSIETYKTMIENIVDEELSSLAINVTLETLLRDENLDPASMLHPWSSSRQRAATLLRGHDDELSMRHSLALMTCYWSPEITNRMVFTSDQLRTPYELGRMAVCARRWPNLQDDFLPHANRILIDRHVAAVTGKCSEDLSLKEAPYLTREDLDKLITVSGIDDIRIDDADIQRWIEDDTGSLCIESKPLREWKADFTSFLLARDHMGFVVPREKYRMVLPTLVPSQASVRTRNRRLDSESLVDSRILARDTLRQFCQFQESQRAVNERNDSLFAELRLGLKALMEDVKRLEPKAISWHSPVRRSRRDTAKGIDQPHRDLEHEPAGRSDGGIFDSSSLDQDFRSTERKHCVGAIIEDAGNLKRRHRGASESHLGKRAKRSTSGITNGIILLRKKQSSSEQTPKAPETPHIAKPLAYAENGSTHARDELLPPSSPFTTSDRASEDLSHICVHINWACDTECLDFITIEAVQQCNTTALFFELIESQLPVELRSEDKQIKEVRARAMSPFPGVPTLPRITRHEYHGQVALRALIKKLLHLPKDDAEVELLVCWTSPRFSAL